MHSALDCTYRRCDAAYMCIRESRVCPQKPRPSKKPRARGKGKETRPANMKDRLPRRSTLQIMQSTRSTQTSTFPKHSPWESLRRWVTIERCIGFSSTAVRSIYCMHSRQTSHHLEHHHLPPTNNSLAAFLHASSPCLGMWTVKTFYRHNAMHLATRLTHTYLCILLFVTIAYLFHHQRRQRCY
jgi:hypothetical protein